MGAKPFKKIVATTGEYTNSQGEKKKRYLQVGTLFQQDDGNFSIKLDAIPVVPEWSGWLSCYDLDKKKTEQEDSDAPPF